MARVNRRRAKRAGLLAALREGHQGARALMATHGLTPRTLTRLLSDLRADGHRVVSVREGRDSSYRLEPALPEKL